MLKAVNQNTEAGELFQVKASCESEEQAALKSKLNGPSFFRTHKQIRH